MTRGHLLAFTFALAATGCFSPRYFPAQYHAEIAQKLTGKRVIIHPTELRSLPPVRASDLADVDRSIRTYVEAHGYVVQDFEPARKVFGSLPVASPKELLANYFHELEKRDLCDLLMIPTIVVRQAELRGSSARWDGVVRPIPATGDGREGEYSGFQKAASLSIAVHTCQGELVLSSLGGIEIPFVFEIAISYESSGPSPQQPQPQGSGRGNARSDYLQNAEHVADAIQLALHPLIAMPGYPDDPALYEY